MERSALFTSLFYTRTSVFHGPVEPVTFALLVTFTPYPYLSRHFTLHLHLNIFLLLWLSWARQTVGGRS